MFNDRLESYKALEKLRASKLLVYVTGDRPHLETQIHREVLDFFVKHLDQINDTGKISLFLYTRGGDTLAALGIFNLLRQFCDDLEVIVPFVCHSSGTLIALGCDRIVMTKQATLGPIDPSLNGPLNPPIQGTNNPNARVPVSVESIKAFFDMAKNELGIRDPDNLTKLLLGLSEKIHPVVLGDVFRATNQIRMIAERLLNHHFKDKEADSKKIKKIIGFLASESGSHDYTINRREAEEELGLDINKPDDNEYALIKSIYDDISKELELNNRYDPKVILGNGTVKEYSFRRAIIESVLGGCDVYVSSGTLTKTVLQAPMQPHAPVQNQEIIRDNRKFDGWMHE